MSTLSQWIHLAAAVVGIGSIGFIHMILIPSARALEPEQRDLLFKNVARKYQYTAWSVVLLLIGSGLYNIYAHAWGSPGGVYWTWLTVKIVLAFCVFFISLGLNLPFAVFDWLREKRSMWLSIAFALAMIVILISAFLRRGGA